MNARVLAEVAQEIDLGAASAARQGRGRGRRPRQAVDPRRRVRSGRRRRVSRQRISRPRAISCCAACASASPRPSPGPGGRDYKTRLQELAAARSLGRPRYVVRDEGPDHAKHFFAVGLLRRRALTARAKADRRSRPSRPRRGSRGLASAGRHSRTSSGRTGGRRCRSYLRSRSCAATSNVRSSARRSSRWRSPARGRCAGTRTRRSSSTSSTGRKIMAVQRRGKYLVMKLDGTDALDRAPRHVGPAAAREDRAREGAEAHARRDHVHAGRLVALRRPAHVRRDVRRAVRRDRPAGRGARAPRARSARDRAVVGPVRPHARRAQDAS